VYPKSAVTLRRFHGHGAGAGCPAAAEARPRPGGDWTKARPADHASLATQHGPPDNGPALGAFQMGRDRWKGPLIFGGRPVNSLWVVTGIPALQMSEGVLCDDLEICLQIDFEVFHKLFQT
jgi:hypothetical protein